MMKKEGVDNEVFILPILTPPLTLKSTRNLLGILNSVF